MQEFDANSPRSESKGSDTTTNEAQAIRPADDGESPPPARDAAAESSTADSDHHDPANREAEAHESARVAQEPARSPAEAFSELAAQIAHARRDIAQVADFARGTGMQLQRAYDDVFLQGADAALRGLLRIDELIFKQSREGTTSWMHYDTAALVTMLGQAVEGELRSVDVQVIEPQLGDALDLGRMVAIANRPAPLLRGRRAGSIAEVISRGYVHVTPQREQILKKAEVVIWRTRDDVAFDDTEKSPTTKRADDE